MLPEDKNTYEFANFRLDRRQKVLFRGGTPVPLTPKVYDTLELLVENSSRLLDKDELMQRLWPDRFVEESNLTSNIKMLRKALGDDASHPRFIETVPRRGYRFIGDVRLTSDPAILPQRASETTFVDERPPQKRYVLITITVVLIISAVGIAFVQFGRNSFFKNRQPKLTRLTTSGKITNAALAPDGNTIVFSQKDGRGESLWRRQIDSGIQTQVLPVQEAEFVGLAVSPDSKFAYYSAFSKNAAVQSLARVSLDGGDTEPIRNVDTDVSVSFSPDGKRFAFTDTRSSLKETSLNVADADGTNQRLLLRTAGENRILPFFRASPVAWSPDGKNIATAIQESDETGLSYRILLVDAENGAEKYVSTRSWSGIENIVWQDSDNIAFIEFEPNLPIRHIWRVTTTTGEARQLTNDLNSYQWLSSAAGRLVTLQKNTFSSLHVAGFDGTSSTLPPKQIFGESGLIESVGWTRGDKILYNSLASGKNEIWEINADGTASQQLTTDSNLIYTFAISPVDDSLVFSTVHNGKIALAAAEADGGKLHQITDGTSDIMPVFKPTGESVVFQRGTSPPTLWSITTNGSQMPEQLTGYQSTNPTVSPDGRQIAFHFMDFGGKDPHWKLGLIDSVSHTFLNKLEFPVPITKRDAVWGPGADLLTMVFGDGENSSILLWSLADGKAQTLQNIDAGRIEAFAWSPDRSRLVFSEVFETSDIVSLENF
jgi:DNA-binding winged helix-turn-helix (wHTH) protein/Tol biopolymer transport system component